VGEVVAVHGAHVLAHGGIGLGIVPKHFGSFFHDLKMSSEK
jgi:hypothetical protein